MKILQQIGNFLPSQHSCCSVVGQVRADPQDFLGLHTPPEVLHRSWYTPTLAAGLMGTRAPTRPSVSVVLLPIAGCSLGIGHSSQSPESTSSDPALSGVGRFPRRAGVAKSLASPASTP